jgi:hypothetical protein
VLKLNCDNHQVFCRKLFLTVNAVCIVALSTVCFGYAVANAELDYATIYSIYVIFSTYLLIICALSLKQRLTGNHCRSILHITVLSTTAVIALGVSAIIPTTIVPQTSSVSEELLVQMIWYTVMGLCMVMTITALTTRLGPALHYPPEKIYTEKTTMGITNPDQENVCGIVGAFSASPFRFR